MKSVVQTMDLPYQAIKTGRKDLTSGGTKYQLTTADIPCRAVIVKSISANAGIIYIGNSTAASSTGYDLDPGESVMIMIDNVSKIYAVGASAGDDLCYMALCRE